MYLMATQSSQLNRRRVLAVFLMLCGPLIAQTDYFYTISNENLNRAVYGLALNSRTFRQVPSSPYPMEASKTDRGLLFVSTLVIQDPGSFLYATRQNPNQIYGYRRLLDGQLEPLPGFPLTFLNHPGTSQGGFVWMVKHPNLPVVYVVDGVSSSIRSFEISPSGALLEHETSPFNLPSTRLCPLVMVFSADEKIAFLSTFNRNSGILSLLVDPLTGQLSDARQEAPLDFGRGLAITPDGCYLYASEEYESKIHGYSVSGRLLTPLPEFPITTPINAVWIFIQDRFLAIGGDATTNLAIMVIAPDGTLAYAPGSPFEIYAGQQIYASFSPRGDRIFFGGNTYLHAFDLAPDGRVTELATSPITLGYVHFGTSVAPELKGDPFSLRFQEPQLGDPNILIAGDPNTPFYFEVDDRCSGPHLTDARGEFRFPIAVTPDTHLAIKPYCDDALSADSLVTVPVLSHNALWLYIALLLLGAFTINRQLRRGSLNSYL